MSDITVKSPTTKVVVNTTPKNRIAISQGGGGGGGGVDTLRELHDVITANASNGQVLVYDSVLLKYVVKELPAVNGVNTVIQTNWTSNVGFSNLAIGQLGYSYTSNTLYIGAANNVHIPIAGTFITDKINVVFNTSNSAFVHANAGFDVANAAFASANNVAPQVEPAYRTANAAFVHANAAFDKANTGTGGYFAGNNGYIGEPVGLGDIFRVHTNILSQNVTIFSGNNAIAAGPIAIAVGKKLTIESGSRVVIT